MRRCAPNSTRSREKRPRSKPSPRSCASTSNWRASRTAGLRARSSNCPTKSPPRRAQITELEHQLAQESSQRRTLSENRRTLQEQLDAAEKRSMRTRRRIGRRAREAGAARRRKALAADRGRSGVQRDRPPHPPPDREREHADRDPRPARQGRGELRGSLCRTRPACRRARRDPRAAPGRTEQPEHAARRACSRAPPPPSVCWPRRGRT